MTTLDIAAMSDADLARRLELAQTTFLLAQTAEQRRQLMQLTADIMQEQERRGTRRVG